MNSCSTCGMPLEGDHANDFGIQTEHGPVCKYDIENGTLKSPEAIFAGGVTFFTEAAANGDRALAERLTRKNMNALHYWQTHHFAELDGEQATDEEFQTAMTKL